MEKDWVNIYSSVYQHKVEIVKAVLEDNGITSVIINKQDSVYTSIGEIELYVNVDNEVLSKFLISENSL
jgi:hypothetical protein